MLDFVKVLGLKALLDSEGIQYESRNFEDIYEEVASSRAGSPFMKDLQDRVYRYFEELEMPEEATLYDRLILSLRRKDLIATFNWDPFLVQAYLRNRKLGELPPLAFLHGSVAVVACHSCRRTDFKPSTCGGCSTTMKEVTLLYPVSQKGYHKGDPFIANEWARLEAVLDHAYFLTIFGYSAPKSDVEAKRLMKAPWSKNRTLDLAQIELVNLASEDQLLEDWKEFIVRNHYGLCVEYSDSWLSHYPRRSCEALAWATLQQDPWHEHPIPDTKDLRELQEWFRPLIEEEIRYREAGEPFKRFTSLG